MCGSLSLQPQLCGVEHLSEEPQDSQGLGTVWGEGSWGVGPAKGAVEMVKVGGEL